MTPVAYCGAAMSEMSYLGDMLALLELVGLRVWPKDLENPQGCGAQEMH